MLRARARVGVLGEGWGEGTSRLGSIESAAGANIVWVAASTFPTATACSSGGEASEDTTTVMRLWPSPVLCNGNDKGHVRRWAQSVRTQPVAHLLVVGARGRFGRQAVSRDRVSAVRRNLHHLVRRGAPRPRRGLDPVDVDGSPIASCEVHPLRVVRPLRGRAPPVESARCDPDRARTCRSTQRRDVISAVTQHAAVDGRDTAAGGRCFCGHRRLGRRRLECPRRASLSKSGCSACRPTTCRLETTSA